MKKHLILLLLFSLVSTTVHAKKEAHIAFGDGFTNQQVLVEVAGQEVFKEVISSSPEKQFAEIVDLSLQKEDEIAIFIDGVGIVQIGKKSRRRKKRLLLIVYLESAESGQATIQIKQEDWRHRKLVVRVGS